MADLKGRATRREFWLFHLLVVGALAIPVSVELLAGRWSAETMRPFGVIALVFEDLIALLATLPLLAVTIRRLHDANFSARWLLLCFIPVFGILAIYTMACLAGSRAANRFGLNPRD
ncbi:MAG: DUF805 domain-containing protein [Caulobacteraceae bacterium]